MDRRAFLKRAAALLGLSVAAAPTFRETEWSPGTECRIPGCTRYTTPDSWTCSQHGEFATGGIVLDEWDGFSETWVGETIIPISRRKGTGELIVIHPSRSPEHPRCPCTIPEGWKRPRS